LLAAFLWSLGSAFMRLLREPLGLGLNEPALSPLQIAFFRGVFGGLFMLALVRRQDVRFSSTMLGMVIVFAAMSSLYLSALALGPAANAIFLQNTAPLWVFVITVVLLRQRGEARGWQTAVISAIGAMVIVLGNWPWNLGLAEENTQDVILLMGLGSGVLYAVVVLVLSSLRDQSAQWLVALNLLGTSLMLAGFVLLTDGRAGFSRWVATPSPAQLVVLLLFGAIQMAVPYWLFARGLRTVSPQEAALITLLEPLLNPVWAYMITPEKDTPNGWMFCGGGLILFALVWRYVPGRSARVDQC
jgi:drug/metabolite transporter (DMT)-like permease